VTGRIYLPTAITRSRILMTESISDCASCKPISNGAQCS
jgi:hypothetical protein